MLRRGATAAADEAERLRAALADALGQATYAVEIVQVKSGGLVFDGTDAWDEEHAFRTWLDGAAPHVAFRTADGLDAARRGWRDTASME